MPFRASESMHVPDLRRDRVRHNHASKRRLNRLQRRRVNLPGDGRSREEHKAHARQGVTHRIAFHRRPGFTLAPTRRTRQRDAEVRQGGRHRRGGRHLSASNGGITRTAVEDVAIAFLVGTDGVAKANTP